MCFFVVKFIYLFLVVLGLRCRVQTFSSCNERELLFIVVLGLLIAVACLVAEHRLQCVGFSNYSIQAQQLLYKGSGAWAVKCWLMLHCVIWTQLACMKWNLPKPRIQLMCPALTGGFLTTGPPAKSKWVVLFTFVLLYVTWENTSTPSPCTET